VTVSQVYEIIDAEKANFPVRMMCRALSVSRSGYYESRNREPSQRDRRMAEVERKACAAFDASHGTYGSPRLAEQLRKNGETVSTKTVAKAMKNAGLVARTKRRFKVTTDSRDTKRIAPNLLARDFVADAPNSVWVGDVTALRLSSGWDYLAVLLDLYSRRVVGWQLSGSNDTQLAFDALRRALDSRQPGHGLIHHTDRGSPYASDDYIAELDRVGALRSMSRKGDCWDNAVAESFFGTLEQELVGQSDRWEDVEAARHAVGDYINHFYNAIRRHRTLGQRSPVDFETQACKEALVA